MKRDTVAKLPGLFQRGTVWWLRVMVPLDLQPAYGRRKKLVQSLDTSDWREASTKGAKLRADKLAEFEDLRRALNPQPVAHLTPDLGATLGARIRSRLLQWDDDLRADPKRAQVWLAFTDAVSWQTSAARTLQINPARGPIEVTLPSDEDLAELAAVAVWWTHAPAATAARGRQPSDERSRSVAAGFAKPLRCCAHGRQ